MRILHIAPNAPYNDYWGYQENLLPKYQKKMGHEVTLIITNTTFKNGKIVEIPPNEYILDDGVKVIRVGKKRYFHSILTNLNSYIDIYEKIVEIKPDFIFYHGLISSTIFDVIKYKRKNNSNCVIVQDNHMDYNNGRSKKNIKDKLIWWFYKNINKKSQKYVEKIYGVTPWRKQYAEDYFNIDSRKTDVLIMGADDEKIGFKNKMSIRDEIRRKYNIEENEFLIVTGGKIDCNKNIDVLMEAVGSFNDVKLLIFGRVLEDIKEKFYKTLEQNKNILYIDWIDSDKVYDYFFAADLVCFPGGHSVLWEQACACKVPCVFKKWEGMDHVNNGGNSDFIENVNIESIVNKIKELKFTPKYYDMKSVAESSNTDIYLYSKIAEKSLECCKK